MHYLRECFCGVTMPANQSVKSNMMYVESLRCRGKIQLLVTDGFLTSCKGQQGMQDKDPGG